MITSLRPMIGRMVRRGGRRRPAHARSDRAKHRLNRRFVIALDDAIERGDTNRAQRLARWACRRSPLAAPLAERIARFELSRDNPTAALDVLATIRQPSDSIRLLRNVCMILAGQAHEAHTDLFRWSHAASAPLAARNLLALLESIGGDDRGAFDALQRNLRQMEDPRSLELFALMSLRSGRNQLATELITRLRDTDCRYDPHWAVQMFVASLNMTRHFQAETHSAVQIQTLAMELATSGDILPALVAAQEISPKTKTIGLLLVAIQHALSHLQNTPMPFTAMAKLLLLSEDRDGARVWLDRGLRLHPMSAELQALHQTIDGNDVSDGDVIGRIGDSLDHDNSQRRSRAA